MKQLRLSFLSLLSLFATSVIVHAESPADDKGYEPNIYMVAHKHDKHAHDTKSIHHDVASDFSETARHGFQQMHNPQFIFSTPDKRFSLGIGGSVTLRTSYDFKGAMGNIDFVPYDIPMNNRYANRQRIMMDASTSRLFLKAIVNTERLGRIVIYTDMDFRGGDEFSYMPRLRSAYVQFKGFTLGRDVSTFCDLGAAATTIDFQGPNAYNYRFTEMIRFEHSLLNNYLRFGIAAEMPTVDATYGEHFSPIYQRVPDGIAYVQVQWGEHRTSHLRASGVIRDMYLHDNRLGENTTQLGWGVQLSGHIDLGKWVDLYMNGVYSRGITPYIQDLTGSHHDFEYIPNNPTRLQTLPMWGWQAAAQLNIVPERFWLAGGYSEAQLEVNHGALSDSQYRHGQYIFGNAFCRATANLTFALEYLHGSRKDVSGAKNHSNRISIMAQYNF
jgi:hypothetical protein